MIVHSVGITTDLALIATRGRVVDRGSYLVTLTPDDPGYYHGNMLVLPAPPRPGELPALIARFAHEIPDPAVRHVTLIWDGVTGDTGAAAELTAAGFEIEPMLTMTTVQVAPVPPPRPLPGAHTMIELRPLAPDEMVRAAELAFATSGDGSEGSRQFYRRRAAWQRDLVVRRLAQFWGAFDNRTLVGSLGLVRLGRLGRYQDVQTALGHRGRGIAPALLAAAGDAARADGVEELVIITAIGGTAARIYQRAGFRITEVTVSAFRVPQPASR